MTAALEQLRAEHAEQFIGPELQRLLARIAAATCKTYPPEYSDAGVWNTDAVQDTLQDWTAERLIGRADLTALLVGAASVASLRAGLTRSLSQFLTNRRRTGTTANLYRRTVDMLATSDQFAPVTAGAKPSERQWTLQATPKDHPTTADTPTLLRIASELSDEDLNVVRYGPYSLKSSPILRRPALERFLVHLLDGADGTMNPGQIMEVMRLRFGLVEPAVESLENLSHIHVQADFAVIADERLTARAIVARLGRETADCVQAVTGAESYSDVAADLGVSEEHVHQQVLRAVRLVANEAADEEQAQRIYGHVVEIVFGEDR